MTTSNIEKQMRKFLDHLVALPNYRAEPWVLSKADLALIGRYSQWLMRGNTLALDSTQEATLDCLVHGFDHDFVRLTYEHENQGLAWLWSQHDKGWLTPQALRILRSFTHFTTRGVSTERNGYGYQSTPLYRVHGRQGVFEYEGWSWQSGRKPKVISLAFWPMGERNMGVELIKKGVAA